MELTVAMPREELVRKYQELCEKHEQLLKRTEEQALERIVVSRLSRAALTSRISALALIESGRVVDANPAWRSLDTPSAPREWSSADNPSRTFATLADAALESANSASAPNRGVFVRVVDGVRVRLGAERLEAEGELPAAILLIAIEDGETGARLHRVRNHLAAAQFQTQLLLENTDPEVARRANSIAELVQLAADALEPNPQAAT